MNVKDSPNSKDSLPKNVIILGLVSLFNDLSSEMIYPIVPIFLTSVLKAPIQIVGLIEGIAEATASISKFLFGAISDYFQKRKPFVVLGYSFGAASKVLISFASVWPLVLFARFIDRLGKGLRTASRDSLLLQNAKANNKGFIFGFHRSLDSLGAVIGPLIALILLKLLNENMRLIFLIASIPAFIAVILLILYVTEKASPVMAASEKNHKKGQKNRYKVKISWNNLDKRLKLFLIISFIFALGNSSDVFIILRANNLGFTTTLTVLSYILYNISQTAFAVPAGKISDKIGAKKVFSLGLIVFSIIYLLFGIIKNPLWFWVLFPIYGIYIAATDGVSKAYVSEFIKEQESGTYFGLYHTLSAIGGFLASFVGGILWSQLGPSTTFFYGSIMALTALIIFWAFKVKSTIYL